MTHAGRPVRRLGFSLALVLTVGVCLVPAQLPAPRSIPPRVVRLRLLLGVGDAPGTRWDGAVKLTGGSLRSVELGRPGADDRLEGFGWKAATQPLGPGREAVAVSVLATAALTSLRTSFAVQTAFGSFSFPGEQADFGEELEFLDGRARVQRVPLAVPLDTSGEHQDYAAAAQSGDTVYAAYVAFVPGDQSHSWPRRIAVKPLSYESLARPAGGDQVLLAEYSRSRRSWTAPQAVSAVRQDVAGTAVAVDGLGRLWVFWSAQGRQGFDLLARVRDQGRWLPEIRVAEDPGPDLHPVAATDSTGTVWVAWQGFRRDNFDVLVSRQQGLGFSREERVSTSAASDWHPQIAAGPNGEVAIAWDTYDQGNYDVVLRRLRFNGRVGMELAVPIAATPKFEARPSLIYDRDNRLWVAYEESSERWGKEFGAYNTAGSGLYQGRTVRVRILGEHGVLSAADRLEAALEEGASEGRPVAAKSEIELPDAALARRRAANGTPYPPAPPAFGYPRLATDRRGVVFLAYRAFQAELSASQRPVWLERLVFFDGRSWSGPIPVPESDHRLDQQPALLSTGPGELLVVGTTDGRWRRPTSEEARSGLVISELDTGVLGRAPSLRPAVREAEHDGPVEDPARERQQRELLRNYRLTVQKEQLQLLRGDFRRYTEMSAGGEREGSLSDAFRYALDAAGLDWFACCDEDNGHEYAWWTIQKWSDMFHLPGRLVTLFAHDRVGGPPEGSRMVLFGRRGVRPLSRLAPAVGDFNPARDTEMLREYLRRFEGLGIVHSPTTARGISWTGHDPALEPVVELYQGYAQSAEGAEAPRTAGPADAIGGWHPEGVVSNALAKGYRFGFGAASGRMSTQQAYTNLWVTAPTRPAVLEALRKRRVYGSTADILADVTCEGHLMGEEFRVKGPPMIRVKLTGTTDFRRVHIIKDGRTVYTGDPRARVVDFGWSDPNSRPGTTAAYYVRGEQSDGELVWSSPMWITVE
jgi:hypothetical protein